jgi:hypothetical protein
VYQPPWEITGREEDGKGPQLPGRRGVYTYSKAEGERGLKNVTFPCELVGFHRASSSREHEARAKRNPERGTSGAKK